MPRRSSNILSDAYRQYIKSSLITQTLEGNSNLEWLQFYRRLFLKQAAGTRPSLFLKRTLAYINADNRELTKAVTGKEKPPLAFPRKIAHVTRRKLKNILKELSTQNEEGVSETDAKFDFQLNGGLTEVFPYAQNGEIPARLRKRRRTNETIGTVAKRGRRENSNQDRPTTSARMVHSIADEIEDKVPPLGQNPVQYFHPYDIAKNLGEVRIPFISYKYMGGFDRDTHFDKSLQFFNSKFLELKNVDEMLLKMFPLRCPSVVNYTIAGVKRKGTAGTYVDINDYTEVVGKRSNIGGYETAKVHSKFFTFRRKFEADRCIVCNRKFKKMYYLLIHYNTCYPRLDFLVNVPKNARELKQGFQIIIAQNAHYSTEHFESLPLLPGEAANRFNPHFFMNPWDNRMMRDHVYIDLTTFIAGYIDTEQVFVATRHPLRFCDYYYHRMLIETSGIDHQTGVLQLLWIEFIYLLSIETCRSLTPYVLYRVFIHLKYQELHDLRLLPAMGNHIQYYTKKKIISRKLGRDIADRLNGRKKMKPTRQLDVLFKKMLCYIEASQKRHNDCLGLFSYETFLANPIEPNILEVEQLAESVLSFPFNLLEDTKYSIVSKVFNLAQKLSQKNTYGLGYESALNRRR